eukprot:359001-Chlamydomonas_euryale.AAC.1
MSTASGTTRAASQQREKAGWRHSFGSTCRWSGPASVDRGASELREGAPRRVWIAVQVSGGRGHRGECGSRCT